MGRVRHYTIDELSTVQELGYRALREFMEQRRITVSTEKDAAQPTSSSQLTNEAPTQGRGKVTRAVYPTSCTVASMQPDAKSGNKLTKKGLMEPAATSALEGLANRPDLLDAEVPIVAIAVKRG